MTLENYIIGLNNIKNSLPNEVDKIVLKNEKLILGMLKFRLFNFGTDGNDDSLEGYSKKTIEIKKKNNQKYNITTLRDQGNFYAGMYLDSTNGKILISSTASQTSDLVNKYGEAIFDLTYKQQQDIISNVIDPELQNLLDSLGNIEIKL